MAGRPLPPLAVLGLAVAFTIGLFQTGRALLHPKQGLDFAPNYVAARMVLAHRDAKVYDHAALARDGAALGLHGPLGPEDPVIEYAYAPWTLMVYALPAWLPFELARRLWFAIGLLASLAAVALLGRALAPAPAARRDWMLGSLAAASLYVPLFFGLMDGQANDLPLLGVVLALVLLARERPLAAGLVLAPAVAWKLFPVLIVLFLLARREWRALGGLALGLIALFVLSLAIVSPAVWADWIAYLPHKAAAPALRNQSIEGNALLLLTANPVLPALANRPDLARAVTIALRVAALLAVLLALRPARRRGEPAYALQMAITLVLALLLTPLSWEHYAVFLLPAYVACAAVGAAAGRTRALVVAGASFAIWAVTFQLRQEYEPLLHGALVLLVPLKLYATMALLGACAALSLASASAPAAPPPAPAAR